MKHCEHSDTKSSIVRSDMTATVYRVDCKTCGRSLYHTEVTAPHILEDDFIRSLGKPNLGGEK